MAVHLFWSCLLSLVPFAGFVKSGLLGRVDDGLGNHALQRSNPQRQHGFLGHRSLLVRKHGKRVLALQSLAAPTRGKIDLKAVLAGFGKHAIANCS